ncbi:RdgB/HAM1 family non-canonical purine NTP pyrophosphatase [Sediminibacterium soli]|uniref:RdgB/HAM1 family non-canonical purine NTP pyrophosphatase n=1 Tax=Sediminibacterium soli TaxID=2698829 RepID=UPI0013794D03|nr:RdgB/HAM1 family non-canonical purine NTP pyrophosphatase [Sediminibacterium soli]NCI47923.1 RdgB/HAM1 family non-canonical purine NTP pyrophosphatase [Sediminibacterium soli]
MTHRQTLVFATNNEHKVTEARQVIGDLFRFVTLKEAGIDIDIPEPHDTLEANATEKSQTIYRLTGRNCFSEDTGLETDALNGEPGVKTARYAGDGRDFQQNIDKLLHKLEGQPNRRARFRAVISLILDGKEYQFEGVCEGTIAEAQQGREGFGYDPVFIPEGAGISFAEMTVEEKNRYNHRQKAITKMIHFLDQQHA